jgi:hypothetical protein
MSPEMSRGHCNCKKSRCLKLSVDLTFSISSCLLSDIANALLLSVTALLVTALNAIIPSNLKWSTRLSSSLLSLLTL